MALAPLAAVADLNNRGIDTTNLAKVDAFLLSASSVVRDAAGVPISRHTFTVDLAVLECEPWLLLPGQPVTDVASVAIDGTAVTDFKLVGGNLWRRSGWLANRWEPGEVTVTLTGGLPEVPADIKDLVCSLVGLALSVSEEGNYASRGDLVGVRVDDASEQYDASSGGKTAGVMELPPATRSRLSARFGGGASVLRSR